jgi:hypothetical protein
MVGDELHARGVREIFGVDIISEAKYATLRDRPGVYEGYLVTDMAQLPAMDEEKLEQAGFNCLVTVAALGFADIPPSAFLKGLALIDSPGLMAFNIKEDFLREEDTTGFSRLIRRLSREDVIQIQAYRRYRHRLSMTGEPLYYVAMVARKLKDPTHRTTESFS